MGYFANGTEGMSYQDHYCQKCENWTAREGDSGVGCPIIDMHMIDNYELCNVEDNYLNKLIPISENGLYNEKCVMFLPQKKEEQH